MTWKTVKHTSGRASIFPLTALIYEWTDSWIDTQHDEMFGWWWKVGVGAQLEEVSTIDKSSGVRFLPQLLNCSISCCPYLVFLARTNCHP